jgi:hypothetical protein
MTAVAATLVGILAVVALEVYWFRNPPDFPEHDPPFP